MRHAEEESDIHESFAGEVEVKDIVLEAVPRAGAIQLLVQIHKKLAEHGVGFGIARVNIVPPKGGAIILGGSPAQMAIGNEEIAVAIEIEVRARDAPAPTGTGDLMIVRRLSEAVFAAEK
jgi:hypothetical protein